MVYIVIGNIRFMKSFVKYKSIINSTELDNKTKFHIMSVIGDIHMKLQSHAWITQLSSHVS